MSKPELKTGQQDEIASLRVSLAEAQQEIKQARGTAQYWKDNHLAGNAEIDTLRDQLALAKAERDENERVFIVWRRRCEEAENALGESTKHMVPLSEDGTSVFIDGIGPVPLDFDQKSLGMLNEIERLRSELSELRIERALECRDGEAKG